MGPLGMLLLTTSGGVLLYAIMQSIVRTPGASMQSKFVQLGTLTGENFEEIANVVGLPNSISSTIGAIGKQVIVKQWMATGYHIVLLFDENDVCLGVSQQTSV